MQRENITLPGTKEHKLFLQRLGFVKCGVGFAIYVLTAYLQNKNHLEGHVVLLPAAVAVAIMVLGAMDYARSKGLNPAYGILAIFTIIGVFFLVAWPDNYQFNDDVIREAKKNKKKGK